MKIEKKNVVLQENGTASVFPVYELELEETYGRTNVITTKTTFIPRDRFDIGSLKATKNGHYSARSQGVDGFSNVEVDVELPYEDITRTGTKYRVYTDINGRPHIAVMKGTE